MYRPPRPTIQRSAWRSGGRRRFDFVADKRRYSPPVVLSTFTEVITGSPDPKHVSTSYIERQNLTMRMSMRRFTRLYERIQQEAGEPRGRRTLHYMHYNFVRIHGTLRVTPAMQAGLTNRVWSIEDFIGLLEVAEREPAA